MLMIFSLCAMCILNDKGVVCEFLQLQLCTAHGPYFLTTREVLSVTRLYSLDVVACIEYKRCCVDCYVG